MKKEANIFIIILSLIIILPGCENSIQPLNEEKGFYSIYGYLNMHEDVNHIRVKNLNMTLSEDTTDNIDANVTLKNLKSGETEELEDTVVTFDGVKTHNFRTTMDIKPNTKYRVSVERSDGKTVTATATSPYNTDTNVEPVGENCNTNIEISFVPVRSRNALRLEVGFRYNNKLFWTRQNQNIITFDQKIILSFTPSGLLEDFFSGNEDTSQGETITCKELDTDKLFVRYTHFGPDLFDNNLSDTLNIPGGAGRFGVFYKDSFSFPIDTSPSCPPSC